MEFCKEKEYVQEFNNFSQETRADENCHDEFSYADEIYGTVALEPEHAEIVSTLEFERLNNIKQLGPMYLAVPNASHTRYGHCVGTYNMSKELMSSLSKRQADEIDFDLYHTRNVKTAALCHDIGHGPFSHTFDNNFVQMRFPELQWCHEKCSAELFEYMIDRNNVDEYEKEDIRMVQDLITGKPTCCATPTCCDHKLLYANDKVGKAKRNALDMSKSGWMFEFVNNKRNSLDVDKLDYLTRDAYYLNECNFVVDNFTLFNNAKILDNQICYNLDNISEVSKVFDSRTNFFENYYCGDEVSSLDLMISDVFFLSNDYYQYDKIIQDKEKYIELDDRILDHILENQDPQLDKARDLVERVQREDFYQCAASHFFTKEKLDDFRKMTPEEISTFATEELDHNEIRVEIKKFDSSLKEKNPLENIKYFDSENPQSSITVTREDLQEIAPKKDVVYYKIYCFITNTSKVQVAKDAFKKAMKDLTGVKA